MYIQVKRAQKETLQEAFNQALAVEKDMISLKTHSNLQNDEAASSPKKYETWTKLPVKKKDQIAFDLESIQKVLNKLTKKVTDIKKNSEAGPSNITSFKLQFKRKFQNKPTRPTEGLIVDH